MTNNNLSEKIVYEDAFQEEWLDVKDVREAVKKLKEVLFGNEIKRLTKEIEEHKTACINGCSTQTSNNKRLLEIKKPFDEIFGEELSK